MICKIEVFRTFVISSFVGTLLTLTACSSKQELSELDEQDYARASNLQDKSLDDRKAYALYAMMSSNSYHNDERLRFSIEKAGWRQIKLDGSPACSKDKNQEKLNCDPTFTHGFTGLAYDIFEKVDADDVVFAFRGTDSKWDYLMANAVIGISPQYKQANKEFRKFNDANEGKEIVLTGHSLGGGLALSSSVREGVDAIVFDSSPRVFDGLGDKHKDAKRTLIYQRGEILDTARAIWRSKMSQVIEEDEIFETRCEFPDGVSNHRADYLAYCLLQELGSEASPALSNIREEFEKSL